MGPNDLRATRLRLGMTQAQFADKLGVSVSRLSDWESGTTRGTSEPCPVPRAIVLACAALAHGLGGEELVGQSAAELPPRRAGRPRKITSA